MSDQENVGLLEALVIGKTYRLGENATVGWWGMPTGINWCEEDYTYSFYIAEFWNTISNLAFVIAGLTGRRLSQQMKLPTRFFALSWTLILLGLTSGLFHASLLWTHQKLDETFENLALVVMFHTDKASQVVALLHSALVATGIFTITSFLFCELHLIGIILLTLYKVRKWVSEADLATQGKAGLGRAVKLAAGSALLGFGCWLIDRLACMHVLRLPFNPQLHAWWHLLCGLALHEGFVLAAALYQFKEALEQASSKEDLKKLPLPLVKPNFGIDFPTQIKLKH